MAKRITEFTGATSLAEGDLIPVVDISDTTQAISGTTKRSAISLIADYIKGRVETLTNKTLSTGSVIDANVTVIEVLKKAYPIGCIYVSTVSTNPSTLFGFGTWEAFGEGRVLVGKASSGTFATAGATMGEEAHTLTVAEMPSHSHTKTVIPKDNVWAAPNEGWNYSYTSGTTYQHSTDATGGGGSHNNIQPSIVVYMWKRTV